MGTTDDRLHDMVARLRETGHRMTPQRLEILRVLVRSTDHPTAEAIYRRLLPCFPSMSLATVYKTIAALKAAGEVLELEFSDRDNRYDGKSPRPHPHLICLGCGAILDPDVADIDTLAEKLAMATGYAILSHRLDFYGLCPACRQRQNEQDSAAAAAGRG